MTDKTIILNARCQKMNSNAHIREVKRIANGYSITRCRDIWGVMCYFGLYKNKSYTEGFEVLADLKEKYPELKRAKLLN
jgi:hypothetical protein